MKTPGTSQAQVTAQWIGGLSGHGSVKGDDFSTGISLPTDFGGRNEGATPEDLLLSALASCYLITFGIILEKNNVSYSDLRITAMLETSTAFPPKVQTVYLNPMITTDADEAMIRGFAERAEAVCLISQAVAGNVIKKVSVKVLPEESETHAPLLATDWLFGEKPNMNIL